MDALLLLGSVVILYTSGGWVPLTVSEGGFEEKKKKAGSAAIKQTSPLHLPVQSPVPKRVKAEVVVVGAAGSSDQLMGEAAPQQPRGPGCRALRPGPESRILATIPFRTSQLGEARFHIPSRLEILVRHGRPERPGYPQPRLAPQAPGLPSAPGRRPRPRIRGGRPGPGGCRPHGADVRGMGGRRALFIRRFGPL